MSFSPLGKGAVLLHTSYGNRTSPVVRGVWVLEAVLGTPPAPPPPDVEPLSPDLRGKKTIREQLDAHRKQPACATCHQKIDPFGFPFENFDELGLWRTQYRDGGQRLKVDPSAELPDGTAVKDVAGLKAALLKKEPDKHTFSSGGFGTPAHLVGELFKVRTGVQVTHVPYQPSSAVGAAPSARFAF